MDVITWTIVGSISGWIASAFVKKEQNDMLTDLSLGILGSLVAGILLDIFGRSEVTGLNIYTILVVTLGAVILIWLGRVLSRA